jgi:hypothetical protein
MKMKLVTASHISPMKFFVVYDKGSVLTLYFRTSKTFFGKSPVDTEMKCTRVAGNLPGMYEFNHMPLSLFHTKARRKMYFPTA